MVARQDRGELNASAWSDDSRGPLARSGRCPLCLISMAVFCTCSGRLGSLSAPSSLPQSPPRQETQNEETGMASIDKASTRRTPWTKGKLVGQKAPLKQREIWAMRIRLQLAERTRELALFNLAVHSKLRSCDLVRLRVRDVTQGDQVANRAIVMQQRLGVRFNLRSRSRLSSRQRPGFGVQTVAEVRVCGSSDAPDAGTDIADGNAAMIGNDPLDVRERRGGQAARLVAAGVTGLGSDRETAEGRKYSFDATPAVGPGPVIQLGYVDFREADSRIRSE